ncbi:MAG TPA: TetR/AcrR family transcriptional regulator, partial [Paenibacillaceae bacterium]|nr:TetR/AcrR family transcriptional regulator [Paenibacillaceae bacterium]
VGMIIEWVNGGLKYSPDYMAEQLLEIIKQNEINKVYHVKRTPKG